jgi:hypothetical protein
MGYTTHFYGRFELNRTLDDETKAFLNKFAQTRRMKRLVDPKYGIEGEFFVDGAGFAGQDQDKTILDYNRPPVTQPSLWCQWVPSNCGNFIQWDGDEKFYGYIKWLEYIIKNFLAPKDYILNGKVKFQGEEPSDAGMIDVNNNIVKIETYKRVFY